jgi:transposase-like protein
LPGARITATATAVERYQRRECSVDEAMLEMYFAGVSTRKVEDITPALWGGKVSAQQMSRINAKLGDKITAWRDRPLAGSWPYVYLDGMILPRRWDGEVANVSILLAVGVNRQGQRDVLGIVEGSREDKASWLAFLNVLTKVPKGRRIEVAANDELLIAARAKYVAEKTWLAKTCMLFDREEEKPAA